MRVSFRRWDEYLGGHTFIKNFAKVSTFELKQLQNDGQLNANGRHFHRSVSAVVVRLKDNIRFYAAARKK